MPGIDEPGTVLARSGVMPYNGWSNYETWCVYTWITNDQATDHACQALARDCAKHAPTCGQVQSQIWTIEQATRFSLADRLKELVNDSNPLAEVASLHSDLLNAAISEVDWHELARALAACE